MNKKGNKQTQLFSRGIVHAPTQTSLFPFKTVFFKAEEEKKVVEEPRAVAEREVSATFRVPVEVELIFLSPPRWNQFF